ncbi:MAG: DEAD/DEAH box helicase [Chloroflexi bacterium]|nr:DEAD/DEAH box helicase [Chloroflexota bacterium]
MKDQDKQINLALVLHGSWSDGVFFVWGESAETVPKPRGRQPRVRPHPYAASPDRLREALETLAPLGAWADAPTTTRVILLPSSADGPHLPPWLVPKADIGVIDNETEKESKPRLTPWKVTGLALDIVTDLDLLVTLPLGKAGERWWGTDLRYWGLVAKLGLEFLAHHKYLPGLIEHEGQYKAVWLPVMNVLNDRARLHALAQAMPPICRAIFAENSTPKPEQAIPPHALLDDFIKRLVNQAVRDWGRARLDRRRKAPQGIASAWWTALWDVDDGHIKVELAQRRELVGLFDAWRGWMQQLRSAADEAFRLCFRLEPPKVDQDSGQVTSPDWALHYMLQANDDPSLLVSAENVWSAQGGTLRYFNRKFEGAQERLLTGLGMAARIFPPIMGSLRTARPQSCHLTVDEAYAFLREIGPLLEGSGFGVLVPPWWDKPGARLGVRAKLKADANIVGQGILSLDSLVQFEWELALGDQPLSRQEFDRLAALKMPLVRVRGQWVMLQADEIEAAIVFWEKKRQQDQMALRDALGMVLGATQEAEGLPLHGVETSGWLDDLLRQLQNGDQLCELSPPRGFVGQLRPYQTRGYSWLTFLRKWGLGACLADDMGLGKTIQAIVLLLRERERAEDSIPPSLVICPTSVVGNWKREIARFGPKLRVMVHHGSDRARGEEFITAAHAHDVVISTYGLARRDVDDLHQITWSDVFLDEAQNIKNPHAKQTQAIRSLPAANRVALTGTPVENRLSELWSIMQFLNPGFLGSQAKFRKTFALPIERYQDESAIERLKGLVGPFVLRRLKTDPTIIQDLPDKRESKVYCNLTTEQTTLYEAVVNESLERVNSADEEGIQRRGVVLGALMRLKQVCNHPAQFLGDGSALAGRSGKLDRLGEMLEEALSVGDQALVFTQFAQMGHMLQAYLRSLFGVDVLFLHGGTPQKRRDRMVARFQQKRDTPIFLLSLKAGGTGLNLTAANHVFHFDRWWNPAVENQATDRAFRIGQTRDVQVYKYICAGTLEERIDELIESKKALAESVVGAGDAWLTELSTDELRDIMTLRRE